MLNFYESQIAGKKNIGHHAATKKNCFFCRKMILADTFFLIHLAILSYLHRQNPGYLKGRLLRNMIWHGKFVFNFFRGRVELLKYVTFVCKTQ